MEKRNSDITGDSANGRSEEYLRLLIESASDYAIFTLNPQRDVISWSYGAERMMKYSEHEMLGRSGDIIFTPEDRGKNAPETETQKADKEGRAQNERWHMRKDGSRFWGSGSVSPLRNDEGTLIGFVKIMRDLTESREAEERYHKRMEQEVSLRTAELKASRGQYASLIENTPDAVTRWNKDLKLIFANSAFESKTGISNKNIVGKTNIEIGQPDNIAIPYMNSLQKAFETGEPVDHYNSFPTHGRVRHFYSSIVPEKNERGEVETVLTIARDITELKEAEQKIISVREELAQKATDKYLTLFNCIDEGFYLAEIIFDKAGRPVNIFYHEENQAAVSIAGVSVKGKKITEVNPNMEMYWYDIFAGVATTGESKRLEQYAEFNKKWFNFYVTKIGDESSREIAIVFQDITDLKRARQEVEQSRDLLQSVFDASYNGLSVLKSLRNERGEIVDMEYMFANQATKRTNKQFDLEGKLYSQVHAGFKGTDYFEVVKRVVETGEPHQGQLHYHFEHLDNWFNITTVKLNDGVVISFEDISEIKKAEFTLRESEERKEFLLQLSDILRPLSHPEDIQAAATRTAMTYFGADRCYYCEIEKDIAIIRRDAAKEGLPSIAASYPPGTTPIFKTMLDAGHPFVVQASNTMDLMDESLRQICIQMQILSYIDVPVIKHGRLVGIFCLTQCTPRTWTATEMELVEEIAERVWAAIERAKAEEALRESEEQKTFLLKLSDSLRPLSDSMEVQGKACQTIAEFLQADRSYYGEVEPDRGFILVKQDYIKGDFPSLAGRHAIQSFASIIAELQEGHIATLEDNRTDFFLSDSESKNCEALYIRAFIAIPLIKDGKLVAYLGVTSAAPRKWTVKEIELLKEVAERTWSAVERAKAEEALRQNEARLATELASTQQLQYVSTRLIQENSIELLYDQILDAAMAIMHSDMVSLQMLVPEKNELLLLAWKGFHPESAKFWKWVKRDSASSCGAALANGERIIVPDVDASAFMAGTEDLGSYHLSGIKAVQSTPLVSRSGKMVGMISCHWRKVHHPANHELGLLDTLGRQAADLIEQRQAGEALWKSEEKYRTLFETMDEGFGIAEVIFDKNNNPADYRWLELNQQFDKLTGASRELLLSGKTFLEILPEHKNTDRYKYYHRVASTGKPTRFEDYSKASDRWFDVNIFRVEHSDKKQIAVLFTDVTERKRREANMRFLAEITDEFSRLSSPDEIMQNLGEKIGTYMQVASCNFVDIDEAAEKEMIISYSWYRQDIPVFPQALRIKDYLTEEFEKASRAGETIVVTNTKTDERTNGLSYDAVKVNSFLAVPFFRAGEWKYFLAVSCPEPRDWRADEVEFFKELADMIFPRLEQVRAIVALRESEARFRLMADAVPVSIWITDAEGRVEFLNKHWRDYAGITFEPTTAATIAGNFLHPADAPAVMAAFGTAMQAGKGFEVEQRNRSKTGEYRWFFNRAEPYRDPQSGTVIKWFGVGVDIHERKKVEKALYESEERLRSLIKNLPGAAAFVVNSQLCYLFAGGESLTDSGLKPEDFIGKTVEEAVRAEQVAPYKLHYSRALQGETFSLEHEVGNHSFLTRGIPLRSEGGEIYAALAVSYDITSRKLAEKAVSKSRERLRVLADAVPQVIWSNDAEGKANFFNQRWYEYSGLSFEESFGVGWEAIVHPDDAPASIEKWRQALAEGKIFDTEYRLRNAAGEYCWFIGRNVPLKDDSGKITGWFGSATDISDLKRAQEAVRNTADRLQLALEAGQLGTYEYDFKTGAYVSTAQHKANFGYADNELVSWESLKERVVPLDREYVQTSFNKALEKDAVYSTEHRTQLPGGDIRWIRSVGRFVYNEKGEPKKMVGITLDITEEKMFTEELSKQVKERTRELQQSNNDLQQFAHVASHDLKEPVRKIKTFNNRIIDDFGEALPQKVQMYLNKINHATDRMFAMIEGVLNYSKLGQSQQLFEPVDLKKILRNIEMDLEVLIYKKNAAITTTKLPVITANETLIYQLFYNLVLNSLKFAKANEPSRINISCAFAKQEQKDFVKIILSDNGIGFEQEYADIIFDTFTRLNPADEYEGTGLGLALCKKIVERHGGSISATGQQDIGAAFTIFLPL